MIILISEASPKLRFWDWLNRHSNTIKPVCFKTVPGAVFLPGQPAAGWYTPSAVVPRAVPAVRDFEIYFTMV
jgi:hypothetical protein